MWTTHTATNFAGEEKYEHTINKASLLQETILLWRVPAHMNGMPLEKQPTTYRNIVVIGFIRMSARYGQIASPPVVLATLKTHSLKLGLDHSFAVHGHCLWWLCSLQFGRKKRKKEHISQCQCFFQSNNKALQFNAHVFPVPHQSITIQCLCFSSPTQSITIESHVFPVQQQSI